LACRGSGVRVPSAPLVRCRRRQPTRAQRFRPFRLTRTIPRVNVLNGFGVARDSSRGRNHGREPKVRIKRWAGVALAGGLVAGSLALLPSTAQAAGPQTLNITVGGDAPLGGTIFEGMRFL